jgi:hypothetical protein
MTSFELVFSLMTIITSLALTHLLAGFVTVLRNAERVRFSPVHALWAWTAFTLTIGNWASYWELRSLTSWPAWAVLLIVTLTIVQYVFCSFVTPQTPADGKIDLADFHHREHRRYILAAAVLFAVALVLNVALGGANFYADWWRDSEYSIAGLALSLLAFFVGARWAQILSATTLAALATYFTIITCNVVAA